MHAGLRNRLLLLPVVVLVAGCDVHVGNLSARATDEWTHTYPLKPGGVIQIDNTNGTIEVESTPGIGTTFRVCLPPVMLTADTSTPAKLA